jgi:hypothetical protein
MERQGHKARLWNCNENVAEAETSWNQAALMEERAAVMKD